jgi:hypothetical protein
MILDKVEINKTNLHIMVTLLDFIKLLFHLIN